MRRTLLLLIALLGTLGLLAGCGTSGGDDATGTTAANGSSADDKTDDGSDEGSGSMPTTEELEALLPTAEEVGSDYTEQAPDTGDDGEDSADSTDDEMDQKFEEACPGISELEFLDMGSSDDGEDDSVTASFATDDDREVEVTLDPTLDQLNEDNLDTLVDALDGCDDIEVTDEEEGFSFTISLQAERDDTYGDFGLAMTFEATIAFFGMEIPLTFAGQAFSVDGIGVTVSATSGVIEDEEAFEMTPVPYDADVLADLSALMEERVGSL